MVNASLFGVLYWAYLNFLAMVAGRPGAVVWSTIQPTATTTTTAAPFVRECHPTPNSGVKQFMIGYGSLMQEASKRRTAPNCGDSTPVTIKGFSRWWNAQGVSISFSTTYLGILEDPQGSFNGVIFELPNDGNFAQTIKGYDDRESWYCRQLVPTKDVISLVPGNTIDQSAEYWIYVNKPEFTVAPNMKYPIVESYVDIFISGCLELQTKFSLPNFAETCVTTTRGWEAPWVNDRLLPRRAFIYEPSASKIDKVLAIGVPNAYNGITIEG